jgi:hypothetical protein
VSQGRAGYALVLPTKDHARQDRGIQKWFRVRSSYASRQPWPRRPMLHPLLFRLCRVRRKECQKTIEIGNRLCG